MYCQACLPQGTGVPRWAAAVAALGGEHREGLDALEALRCEGSKAVGRDDLDEAANLWNPGACRVRGFGVRGSPWCGKSEQGGEHVMFWCPVVQSSIDVITGKGGEWRGGKPGACPEAPKGPRWAGAGEKGEGVHITPRPSHHPDI